MTDQGMSSPCAPHQKSHFPWYRGMHRTMRSAEAVGAPLISRACSIRWLRPHIPLNFGGARKTIARAGVKDKIRDYGQFGPEVHRSPSESTVSDFHAPLPFLPVQLNAQEHEYIGAATREHWAPSPTQGLV